VKPRRIQWTAPDADFAAVVKNPGTNVAVAAQLATLAAQFTTLVRVNSHPMGHALIDFNSGKPEKVGDQGFESKRGASPAHKQSGIAQQGIAFRKAATDFGLGAPDEAVEPLKADRVFFVHDLDREAVLAPGFVKEFENPVIEDV
jgi:hypothetical protein